MNSLVRTSAIGLLQHLQLLYLPSELDITKYTHNEFTHHLIAIKPQTLWYQQSQHPLLYWIVSTAIASDTSSELPEALQFFVDLIKQLDEKQSSCILSVVRRLLFLSIRYELHITFATDVKWPKPFSTDFLLWESISTDSPLDLVKSNIESVSKLYRTLAAMDVLDNSKYMKSIERRWLDLSNDILACLIIDKNLAGYFIELADIRWNPF
jgi:hypothetical protein